MTALASGFSQASGVAVAADGSVYITDRANNQVRRVDPNGIAEIIAGTGEFATSAPDGVLARGTAIGQPSFVAVDGDDNIYFLDWPNARVRKIDRNGILTTFAGNGSYGFSGDGGPATNAQFSERSNDDAALVFDPAPGSSAA